MIQNNLRIFLDTSVVFAAVLSSTGGARKLFLLAEAGILKLVVGPTVLKECEAVIRRKAPDSLPDLARLLDAAQAETSSAPTHRHVALARSYVRYSPDAHVLAEAIAAKPDWFVTHDKQHFLKARTKILLSFQLGTPGELIQILKDDFSLP
jgi:predicted nucleic acid-binding protein